MKLMYDSNYMQSELFQASICYHFDNNGLQVMKN